MCGERRGRTPGRYARCYCFSWRADTSLPRRSKSQVPPDRALRQTALSSWLKRGAARKRCRYSCARRHALQTSSFGITPPWGRPVARWRWTTRSNAVAALMLLKREFPDDPEVLFICVHYFSQLSMRTSQELAAKAPASFQARRLEAEALNRRASGIRLPAFTGASSSRIPASTACTIGWARCCFQGRRCRAGRRGPRRVPERLEVDPRNSASEFVLGELARRGGNWDEASGHFLRASQMDTEFAEAYLALGMS